MRTSKVPGLQIRHHRKRTPAHTKDATGETRLDTTKKLEELAAEIQRALDDTTSSDMEGSKEGEMQNTS